MIDYPKLTFLYWDEPSIPVSLTGKALGDKEDVGSTPTQETN
jgi:hypothetical protein